MKAENEKSRVYRYKTLEEIAEGLQQHLSLEDNIGNEPVPYYYCIYIDENDFSIVGFCDDYIESFRAPYYGECDDNSFEWETLENKDFRNVCEDLLEQVNAYIKERELEDD